MILFVEIYNIWIGIQKLGRIILAKEYIYEDKDESDFCVICGSDSAYYVFDTKDEDNDGKFYCTN